MTAKAAREESEAGRARGKEHGEPASITPLVLAPAYYGHYGK